MRAATLCCHDQDAAVAPSARTAALRTEELVITVSVSEQQSHACSRHRIRSMVMVSAGQALVLHIVTSAACSISAAATTTVLTTTEHMMHLRLAT